MTPERLSELRKTFPIQDGPSVPWEYMAPHDRQCQRNHGGQTLQRIAQRGGLGAAEAELVVTGRTCSMIADSEWVTLKQQWLERAERVNREWALAALLTAAESAEELRRENERLTRELAKAREDNLCKAHVIVEGGLIPGVSPLCRCEQCAAVALAMDEAGYMDLVKDRWWSAPSTEGA